MTARFLLALYLLIAAIGGCETQQRIPTHPIACGGSVTTEGAVRGVAFSADYINVVAVNGNALAVYLTDSSDGRMLWFAIERDGITNMFVPGTYQAAAAFDPTLTGPVSVEVTAVVDPFDTAGQPPPGADGGVVGSVAGTFVAQFGSDVVIGSFSSPVCSVTNLV